MEKLKWILEGLHKTQLLGVLVGGLIVLVTQFSLAWTEREWSEEAMAAAFIGEISAIIETQNTVYLRGLLKALDKGEAHWEPVDQPPERLFTIYEGVAPELGLLGHVLSEKITHFYWFKNKERGKERILGTRYMEFTGSSKKHFLTKYIDFQETLARDGKELIALLRDTYDLNQ